MNVQLHIDRDEWYPFHTLTEAEDPWTIPLEISEESYNTYQRLMKELYHWQDTLGKYYEFGRKK